MRVSEFVEVVNKLGMTISNTVSNSTYIVKETEFFSIYDEDRNITRRVRFALYTDYYDYAFTSECIDTYVDGQMYKISTYSFGFGSSRPNMVESSFNTYHDFNIWYPIVNEYERTISALLHKYCNAGDRIGVRTDTTDAISIYTIPNRPAGFDYVAHKIYNEMNTKYSQSIIGITRHEGSLQFVYDSSTMEEWESARNNYIESKAAWCAKYGCD